MGAFRVLGRVICLALALSLAGVAQAQIDLTQYNLTQKQVELINRLTQKGYSDEMLTEMAQAFERSNVPQTVYIPPHTSRDLELVSSWAVGGAFASYSSNAGVNFNRAAYVADCPNPALFNFGRATGAQFLRVDILIPFANMVYALNLKLQRSPQTFRAAYLEMIRPTQFAKYVDQSEWLTFAELD